MMSDLQELGPLHSTECNKKTKMENRMQIGELQFGPGEFKIEGVVKKISLEIKKELENHNSN